jgi:hypothetical protein
MKVLQQKNIQPILDVLFLAIILWMARYWLSSGFGLYEDDLTRIPNAISMGLGDVFSHLKFLMTHYYANRPLHEGFIYLFSYLGWKIGGLWGAYWVGYGLTVVNVWLFYELLTRLYNRSLALLGGLTYVLFSADTTQAYLTMSLGGQISNTMLLVALHCYISGKRWLSYLLVFIIIMFAYETPFLVFLAAPLLERNNHWKKTLSNLVINGAVMLAMLFASFLMRYGYGGQVDFEMGYRETLMLALTHTLQGPLVALGSYFLRPYQAVKSLNPTVLFISLISFIIILMVLLTLRIDFALGLYDMLATLKNRGNSAEFTNRIKYLFQLALAGAAMMLLAYPLTFTTRILAISGRTTRGHLAGVVGTSLFIACISYFFLSILAAHRVEKLGKALLAAVFALTLGFGFLIQQDYVLAWQYQKDFWTEVLPIIEDADERTAILVQPEGFKDVLQIGANTWNLSRVLEQLYLFPPESKSVPHVYRLMPDWQAKLVDANGLFELDNDSVSAPSDNYNNYRSTDVILINTVSGNLIREKSPLILSGKSYPLKQLTDPVLPKLPKGVLYMLLIDKP